MLFPLIVGSQIVELKDLPKLLERYNLLPQLLRELVIDEAIAEITYSPEELHAASLSFCQRHKLDQPVAQQAWLAKQGLTREQWEETLARDLRVEKFQRLAWGKEVEAVFLQSKPQLDKATYSLLRTQDPYIAQELYCRVQEGEQTFAELAKEFSQGPETQTGGMVGPVALGRLHPRLSQLLERSVPGQLHPPLKLNDWFVVVRLEQKIPAQLDDAMRQTLMRQLYTRWLQERVATLLRASSSGEPA
jgi:parvulin-like peptidyl-prolyl isomerase